jgi:hypothetical protein
LSLNILRQGVHVPLGLKIHSMKLKYLLLLTALVTTLQSTAQIPPFVYDSIQMGSGYANDIYYSMKNGSVTTVSNTNWQLGFEMLPASPVYGGVSIIANHVQGGVKVYSLHLTGTAKFSSLAGSDTANKTLLYNTDSSWDYGAFNANHDLTNAFNYGWGDYNSSDHNVYGDSLYQINVGGNTYKMVVKYYQSHPVDSIFYVFHIAKFDGSGDYIDTIWRKPTFVNKNFAYYDIVANTFLNREPDHNTWDIVFTRYIENVLPGPTPYSVMGVLNNYDVRVADVRSVNPDTTVLYNSYTRTKNIHEIGSDWKIFNMTTFQYDMDTTATFFVQTEDTAIYQIKFTKFESGSGPSGTGKVVFGKRMLAFPTAVHEPAANIAAHTLVPNPSNNETDLVINAKAAANAQLLVTDINGRIAQRGVIDLKKGLNAFRINTAAFDNGIYMVTVTDGSLKTSDKLIVQH